MEHNCRRCGQNLPGEDPLKRRSPPRHGRRYSVDHQPTAPVRVSKTNACGETLIEYWCSSRCFKLAHAKAHAKPTPKGKPTPDQHMHIPPRAA